MRQILQEVNSGRTLLETVPPPTLGSGMVRVRTAASVVSGGTEKMLLDLANRSYLGKALARPDLVRKVWEKIKKEGLYSTYQKVNARLEKPMPLGYSAAGVVEEVGAEVTGFQVGDRVAMAGAGYANHAELNVVPRNLVARIPDGVDYRAGAYATVASIGLQGVRLADPKLGDTVVVIGLGLIGLLTVQLLKASGCRVIGTDLDPAKVELGKEMGLDRGVTSGEGRLAAAVRGLTSGHGADRTLITAATESSGPIERAGAVTRAKGCVVVVGAVGMEVPRKPYYEKELELKVSRSYGPGRYDPSYEEGGIDYPYDYVRWTEQRNMEAALGLMAEGKLDTEVLTSHEFPFDEALRAYELLEDDEEDCVGIRLNYDLERSQPEVIELHSERPPRSKDRLGVGFVGAGNYATLHLIPHVRSHDSTRLVGLATATGSSARKTAEKFGFEYATTSLEELLQDERVDAVFIATRHSTHAEFTARALDEGKHVFVEKPLAVTPDQLEEVRAAYQRAQKRSPIGLMVGLNRRFAPMIEEVTDSFAAGGPVQMLYRVNAGEIDPDSWLYRPEEGGGMLIGEMCHFIDLMQFISGERPARVEARSVRLDRDDIPDHDNVSITIGFDGGSLGTLVYHTTGDSAAPKERLEVAAAGCFARMQDFRSLRVSRDGSTSTSRSWSQDKGQEQQVRETVERFRRKGQSPIPFGELMAGMRTVFAARRSLRSGGPVAVRRVEVERQIA